MEKERKEFVLFLRDYFEQAKQEDYNFVAQTHLRYMGEMMACAQAQVFFYDKFYARHSEVVLGAGTQPHFSHVKAASSFKPAEILHFEKTLLQFGNLSKNT